MAKLMAAFRKLANAPKNNTKKIRIGITDIFRNKKAMLNVNYSTVAFFWVILKLFQLYSVYILWLWIIQYYRIKFNLFTFCNHSPVESFSMSSLLHNLPCTHFGNVIQGTIITDNEGINPLKTKRRPLYLKTQSVPRCKHFSSRL
jgi:hypothetical protein